MHICAISSKRHTAILLFARTAEAEAHVRRLNALDTRNVQAHQLLLDDVAAKARATGRTVISITEAEQRGENFGERIAAAAQEVFHQGFEHLIIIGSDSPGMRQSDLDAAIEAVERGSAVLGQDFRGGAYIIGLQASSFDATAFAQLPWCTNMLAQQLLATFAEADLLPARSDLASVRDWQALVARLSGLRRWSIFAAPIAPQRAVGASMWMGERSFGESRNTRGPPSVQ